MTPPSGNPIHERRRNYERALLAVLPLLAIAAFDLVLLFLWGLEPIWAFAIAPPMLFVAALAWIYFGAVESEDDGTGGDPGDADDLENTDDPENDDDPEDGRTGPAQ